MIAFVSEHSSSCFVSHHTIQHNRLWLTDYWERRKINNNNNNRYYYALFINVVTQEAGSQLQRLQDYKTAATTETKTTTKTYQDKGK